MLEELKSRVLEANKLLTKYNLVHFTWGNVSGIDRSSGLVVIKPSGVSYEIMTVQDMVVVDLEGKQVEGELRPSSDTPTHLVLYQNFPQIGGVVHTHSEWSTIWSQSGLSIPILGTTHADHFYGEIPCTRRLTDGEIHIDYEKKTGELIVETFSDLDYRSIPGVLVNNHGPFCWGKDAVDSVKNAAILENIAKMAYYTTVFSNGVQPISKELLDRHYLRKHGKNAYYGQ